MKLPRHSCNSRMPLCWSLQCSIVTSCMIARLPVAWQKPRLTTRWWKFETYRYASWWCYRGWRGSHVMWHAQEEDYNEATTILELIRNNLMSWRADDDEERAEKQREMEAKRQAARGK